MAQPTCNPKLIATLKFGYYDRIFGLVLYFWILALVFNKAIIFKKAVSAQSERYWRAAIVNLLVESSELPLGALNFHTNKNASPTFLLDAP